MSDRQDAHNRTALTTRAAKGPALRRQACLVLCAMALLAGRGPARSQSQRLPEVARPFPSGLSGTLVFQSDVGGRPALYTLDLARGVVGHLSGEPEWQEVNPRWSPDGALVVFASNRAHYEGASRDTGTPDLDLWLMRADGTGKRRLTRDPANDTDPTWASDGRSIVFSSDRESRGDLYRLWLEDGRVERLTRHYVGRAIMPAVSPEGHRAAFAAQTLRVGAFWDFQIHLLDFTSGRTQPLPASAGACWPRWSHDGRRVAHVTLLRDRPSALDVRDVIGGTSATVVQAPPLWAYYPAWSPDDARLAFSVSPEHHEGENWDLAVFSFSTGRWERLTEGPGNDRLPDWK